MGIRVRGRQERFKKRHPLSTFIHADGSQPLSYIKKTEKAGASPQKWFLSQSTKGKQPRWQAGFRAKDLKAAGRCFPGERLPAPMVVLELAAKYGTPVNCEQSSRA